MKMSQIMQNRKPKASPAIVLTALMGLVIQACSGGISDPFARANTIGKTVVVMPSMVDGKRVDGAEAVSKKRKVYFVKLGDAKSELSRTSSSPNGAVLSSIKFIGISRALSARFELKPSDLSRDLSRQSCMEGISEAAELLSMYPNIAPLCHQDAIEAFKSSALIDIGLEDGSKREITSWGRTQSETETTEIEIYSLSW